MCAQDRLCFVDGSREFCGFEAHHVACAALVCPIMLSRKFPPPSPPHVRRMRCLILPRIRSRTEIHLAMIPVVATTLR